MKTTLNEIKKHQPCSSGWDTLIKSLGKNEADDEPVSLEYILKSNDIKDAVWVLRCFDYLEYCLFLADVAESVVYLSKDKENRPQKAIAAIREYKKGSISKDDLSAVSYAAYADSAYAACAAATRRKKWEEIEVLFIKHFIEK